MRLGLADEAILTDELIAALREPFRRRLPAGAGGRGHRPRAGGLHRDRADAALAAVPVRIIYGERDRILPDVAETMARVKPDLPQAEVTALPDCGHFLQEEAPARSASCLRASSRRLSAVSGPARPAAPP